MTHPKSISTISEFLLHAGTEYIIIDVSRGKTVMDNQVFFEIENNARPFPRPRQGFAWLCIMFWNRQLNDEHYIWYLKLPLDERSLIQPAARDQFLQLVVEALGQSLEKSEQAKHGLPENPFVFEPSQQLRSDCNALLKKHLDLPLSEEAKLAQQYLQVPSVQDWQKFSVQNMSDALVYADETSLTSMLENKIDLYPSPVLNCLLGTLEGLKLNVEQSKALVSFYHRRADQQDNATQKSLILRALAHGDTDTVTKILEGLLESNADFDMELLVVLAGRHWSFLADMKNGLERVNMFMEKVVRTDEDFRLFNGLFTDLVMVPEVRVQMLSFIRADEKHSSLLAKAVKGLTNTQ